MKQQPQNQLTEDQCAEFDGYILAWRERLGLTDWRVERSRKRTANMAEVTIHHKDRLASYRIGAFGGTPITSETIEATALHELLHVLLCELTNQVDYGLTGPALESAEHRVVNTLERLLMEGRTHGS